MLLDRRSACGIIAGGMLGTVTLPAAAADDADRFAGFPPIGVNRKPERTQPVIASDGVAGRAAAGVDHGAWAI